MNIRISLKKIVITIIIYIDVMNEVEILLKDLLIFSNLLCLIYHHYRRRRLRKLNCESQ